MTWLLDEHRIFWCIWSCERATGMGHEVVAAFPEKPPSPAVHQNCLLCSCLLTMLQLLSKGESKPWSNLRPSHLLPWCLRLSAVDKFSCGSMCSLGDDTPLSACYRNGSFHCLAEHCRQVAVEGNVWFLKGFLCFRSKRVQQLGCRLGATSLHAGTLMHMAGWLLPEWGLLLESPCTLLLFPVFPMWFSGECGLCWCYTRGEGKEKL